MTLGVGVQGMPTINFSSFFLTTTTAGPAMMWQFLLCWHRRWQARLGSQGDNPFCRSTSSQANNPSEISPVIAAHKWTDDSDLECEQRRRMSIRSSSNHFMPAKKGRVGCSHSHVTTSTTTSRSTSHFVVPPPPHATPTRPAIQGTPQEFRGPPRSHPDPTHHFHHSRLHPRSEAGDIATTEFHQNQDEACEVICCATALIMV